MGAKASFVAWIEEGVDVRALLKSAPTPDHSAAERLVERLFGQRYRRTDDGDMQESMNPDAGALFVGVFEGLTMLASSGASSDHPSKLAFALRPPTWRVLSFGMHSSVDWFGFAVWDNGKLIRSLSLSPDSGLLEDRGNRLPVELPFWEGQHPVEDEEDEDEESKYPFPFHPLELAEAVHRTYLGFVMEGTMEDGDPDVDEIVLTGFALAGGDGAHDKNAPKRPWWKFW